jgi:hypothetical protein
MNLNDTPSAGPVTEADVDAAIRESWLPRRAIARSWPARRMDASDVQPWHDTMPTQPAKLPACTADACCQGRVPCPTPEACLLEDVPRESMTRTEARCLVAVYVLSTLAVLSAIAALFR